MPARQNPSGSERPMTRRESGHNGIMTRLTTENWDAMIAPALASPDHVSRMDRWRKIADETNPSLTPDQRERLAEKLRTEHYRRMGRLSAASRRRQTGRTESDSSEPAA